MSCCSEIQALLDTFLSNARMFIIAHPCPPPPLREGREDVGGRRKCPKNRAKDCRTSSRSLLRHRWPLSLRGRSFVRHLNELNMCLPAVETAAHGHNAATSPDGRRSLRSSCRRRASSASMSASARSHQYALRSAAVTTPSTPTSKRSHRESSHRPPATGECSEATPVSSLAPALVPSQPSVRSCQVKLEVSSDKGTTEEASIVVDDNSSLTLGDAPTVSRPECEPSRSPPFKQSPLLKQQQDLQQQTMTIFDKDDDAACDDLLLHILSDDGQSLGSSDGFLSLLIDDMITSTSSLESIGCLSPLVKHER